MFVCMYKKWDKLGLTNIGSQLVENVEIYKGEWSADLIGKE